MKRKALSRTNPHLRDTEAATGRLIRSVANSTAVEAGGYVRATEEQLMRLQSSPSRATLA